MNNLMAEIGVKQLIGFLRGQMPHILLQLRKSESETITDRKQSFFFVFLLTRDVMMDRTMMARGFRVSRARK